MDRPGRREDRLPDADPVGRRHDMNQLLTVKQAAQLLSCSEAAIRKWVYQRRLPAVKVGRLTRIRATDVQRLCAAGLPDAGHLTRRAERGPRRT
jgi:excisionase family DNA binding protein